MIELNTKPHDSDEGAETVELFKLDGKPYRVAAKPRVNVSLQLLRDTRKFGVEVAGLMLLEKMLGEEAYDALCDYEDLEPEHLKSISQACAHLSLGALENASGNSGSASEKSAG